MSPRGRRSSIAATVTAFALLGLAAIAVVAVVSWLALRNVTNDEALREARQLTHTSAQTAIEPALTDGAVNGNAAALARLDRAVRTRVLFAPVIRVKLWTLDGRVVYSDARRLIGRRFQLEPEEISAARHGRVVANISDATRPENQLERGFGRLLQVYQPVRTPKGERLLYEEYLRYSSVAESAHRLRSALLPATGGALLVLALAQLPLAWWLARRLSRREEEREALLLRLVESSDRERRRLAQALHERPVQALAGLSWRLSAAARRAPPDQSEELETAAGEAREVLRELRAVLVALHPPSLQRVGLRAALDDIAAPLRAAGVAVDLDVDGGGALEPDVEALVYRVAEEGLRNAQEHAHAQHVTVALTRDDGRLRLRVADDGQGFSPEQLAERSAEGHRGLVLLQDLAAETGGRLDIRSVPDSGTTLELESPAT